MATDLYCMISARNIRECSTRITTPLPELTSENGSMSSPSTLTSVNYNNNKNVLNYQPSCTKPVHPHSSNIMREIDEYRRKLKSLNSLLSPVQLFRDIDLVIKNYNTLKKEYSLQWELHTLCKQQIRSMLRLTSKGDQQSYLMPLDDIDTLIQHLQNIQRSIMQLFQNCFNKKSKKNPFKSAKNSRHSRVITPINTADETYDNIRPNHVKRLSGTTLNPFSQNRNLKKSKSRQKRVRNKPSHTQSSIIQTNKHSTHSLPPSPYPSPLTLLNSSTKMISEKNRRSSIRSFGTLYSEEFRTSVAAIYKSRMTHSTDECKRDDYLGLAQLQRVTYYRDNYIGSDQLFESVFGVRPVIYCDWTASGKALKCVENYINSEMLTLYANTHTNTSVTGIQTSKFRSEARSIILESIGGDTHKDVVLFTGNGATAAIYKISHVLMKQNGYKPSTTVVFISIYEHNSNIYIWKELGCKVIVIPENTKANGNGGLDLRVLEKYLRFYSSKHMSQKYNLLIGSFSAASNVSGIIAPIDECTALLHRYNALSFWDFATAGPYMEIKMTNESDPIMSKDAVFISPHKYMGGPGSPGILCAKKKLFSNYTPVVAGGGTVFVAYGTEDGEWEYLDNIEEREEGGTPNIIGSVRASFAFMVKDHLGTSFIERREQEYLEYFWSECKSISNLIIMGNTNCDRLPVISFLITHTKKRFGSKTKYLHYNFIAALMNDLFGIQGRGGCACAGMYGKYVLNMSANEVEYVVSQLRNDKNELSRPGYFRINLHYTLSKEELEYIISAVKFVCAKGWLFLGLYEVDIETGNFCHRNKRLGKQLRSLLDVSFLNNAMKWKRKRMSDKCVRGNLNKYLEIAESIATNLKQYLPTMKQFKNEKVCDKAWFWLPRELIHDARHYIQ